jgi:RNA polymerase sigma-70 factor (ECF subfamily)
MADRSAETELIAGALAGSPAAVRALIDAVGPVAQARVARALLRSATGRKQGRDLRQDIEDFVQEVFASLFADGARALRAWDPNRGLSLANFVGLVAEHQVASILRSGRRSPWTDEPMVADDLNRTAGSVDGSDERVYSREVLVELLDRLRVELTPKGLHLFQLLVVEERAAEDVSAQTGMSLDAVYAWRSRLGKVVRRVADEITKERSSDRLRSRRMIQEEGSAS